MSDLSYLTICIIVFVLGYKITDQWLAIRKLKPKADKWDEIVAIRKKEIERGME